MKDSSVIISKFSVFLYPAIHMEMPLCRPETGAFQCLSREAAATEFLLVPGIGVGWGTYPLSLAQITTGGTAEIKLGRRGPELLLLY